MSGPLTGDWAQYGAQWKKGFDLALGKINAGGGVKGRQLAYVFEDSQSDPKQSVVVAQKFVADARIIAELGDFSSTASMAASPIYQRAGLVQLGFTNSNPAFTTGGDYMWSNSTTQKDDAPNLAQYAVTELGLKRLGVFYLNTDWGKSTYDLFAKSVADIGGTVVDSEAYLPTDKDFRAAISKVAAAGPDGIVFISYDTDGALIAQQLKAQGVRLPIVADVAIYSPEFLIRPQGLLGGKRDRLPEPMTGTLVNQTHPLRVPAWLGALLVVAGAALPLVVRNPYVLQVLVNAWLFGLLSLSLTLVTGTLGQISMGHAGLLSIGAYASALLSLRLGVPVVASLLLAALLTALLGTLLVSPTFRLRSHYLAIATLGIGEIVRLVILNGGELTRGAMGLPGIPSLSIAGHALVDPRSLYWASLALLVVVALLQGRLARSSVGRAFKAIRDDETAALSHGIGLRRYKAIAFAASGFAAGLCGAFTAHMYSYISSDTFTNTTSILGLTMAILGGLGSIWGAVAGSVILIGLPELFRPLADFRLLVYGLALILLVRFRPGGIFGME